MGKSERRVPRQRVDFSPEEQQGKKKHHIQPQVLEVIQKADGKPVTLDGIAKALGAPKSSVQHAALRLSDKLPQFEVITKGRVWRWNDSIQDQAPAEPAVPVMAGAEPTGPRWYEVGQNAQGDPIIRRDGDPQLYQALPL